MIRCLLLAALLALYSLLSNDRGHGKRGPVTHSLRDFIPLTRRNITYTVTLCNLGVDERSSPCYHLKR
jgi:hypothetical protein